MSMETLLLVVIVVFIVGAVPLWSYSRPWGYTPMGVLGLVLVVFLIWAIASDRPLFRSAGEDLKDAGRDVAASVRHAVQ